MDADEVVYSPHSGLVMAAGDETDGYLKPIAKDTLWVEVSGADTLSVAACDDKVVFESLYPEEPLTVWLEPTARVRVVAGDVADLPSYRQPGTDAIPAFPSEHADALPFPLITTAGRDETETTDTEG